MKKVVMAALVTGALGVTVSAALANPLMLPPMSAPMPHTVVVPMNTVPVQTQVLNTYRQVRAFWLSRAIVR